jgi:hypothetical protein
MVVIEAAAVTGGTVDVVALMDSGIVLVQALYSCAGKQTTIALSFFR